MEITNVSEGNIGLSVTNKHRHSTLLVHAQMKHALQAVYRQQQQML